MGGRKRWSALALLAGLGACEAGSAPADAEVEVSVSHHELDGVFWRQRRVTGPRSYELRVSVLDAGGREVSHETALSPLFAWRTRVTLPCRAGERHEAVARLVGAYEGRPWSLRAGRGGLSMPLDYVARQAFVCPEVGAEGEVRLPLGTSAEVEAVAREDAAVAFAVSVSRPEALRGREVTLTWEERVSGAVRYGGDAPRAVEQVVSDEGEVGADAWTCAEAGEGREVALTARALVLTVDGVAWPRDAWRVAEVSGRGACPGPGEIETVPLTAALELLRAPEEVEP